MEVRNDNANSKLVESLTGDIVITGPRALGLTAESKLEVTFNVALRCSNNEVTAKCVR